MNDDPTYDIPDEATTAGMRALLHAVREGHGQAVPALLAPLPDAERRRCLPVLKTWRRAARDNWDVGHRAMRAALLYAGAGCSTGAAAAAQWIAGADPRWVGNRDDALVVSVIAHRGPEWLAQVVRRLAERRTVAQDEYPLIAAMARTAGCELPTTDGIVLGWERQVWGRGRRPVEDSLRDDPLLTAMVPRLFEVPEGGSGLVDSWPGEPSAWATALAALTADGLLDRGMMVDGCLSRLLRETRPGLVRGFLVLLDELCPTEDEHARHLLTWVGMLPHAHPQTAARAQQALAALDEAGRLADEHLVEASRAALVRPEKKIVRAQLALLDAAMKRDRSRTNALLPVAAEAFGQEEHSLQERALALAVRHRRHADPAVLAELAASAGPLAADLRRRAEEAFGTAPPGATAEAAGVPVPAESPLPPAPVPERLAPPPLTAAELAEDVAVVLHSGGTPAQEERVLNGLVVHARADLAGLRAALEPVAARQNRLRGSGAHAMDGLWSVVYAVVHGFAQRDPDVVRSWTEEDQCPHSALHSVPFARWAEIALRILDDPLPFLLATPTWSTGAIDPADLVERLAAYERSGIEPGPADFRQALLRLDREASPETRTAAERLTSPAGKRLAEWLASGGLPDPVATRGVEPLRLRSPRPGVLVRTEAFPGHEAWPEPFRSLLAEHDPIAHPCRCERGGACTALALAVLPQHREIIAGRMLVSFSIGAEFDHIEEYAPVLPALAESGGPAGPATHLLVAYGLGGRRFESQMYAVDALLTLAARGQLDAARLGADLADLTALRRLKTQRWVAALREASRASAHVLVWSVLSGSLAVMLRGEPPHGTSAVLTLAADCAELCGAQAQGAEIPGIAELASRAGSSQLIKQARRIRDMTAPAVTTR
ncbi:DUF6493 family protein [Nocardiopsis sediminis]|uniref:DUF6493 family protein n=1 Tax=Nocardiopsis sediminis TaxID=1778267 RepID=A0ABV8FPK6_9ACTN